MAVGQRRRLWFIGFAMLCTTSIVLMFQSQKIEEMPTVPVFTENPEGLQVLVQLADEKKERVRLQELVSKMAKQIEVSAKDKAVLSRRVLDASADLQHARDQLAALNRENRNAVSSQPRPDVPEVASPTMQQPPPSAAAPQATDSTAQTIEPTAPSSPSSPPSPRPIVTPAAWGALVHEPVPPLGHRLGVLVPYRDVNSELQDFVPHMHKFLKKQGIDFRIFVINQTDDWRFNRGQLINAGYTVAAQSCDYVVMHDVDLLPLNTNLSYRFPIRPMHLASPRIHPKYHYENFIGGVFVISNADFLHVNGLSNRFWGWGREDDDFFSRLKRSGITIDRPENFTEITTGYNSFWHTHDAVERPRDYMKTGNQRVVGKMQDTTTGVTTSRHTFVDIAVDHVATGESFIRVEVNLTCNETDTSWCRFATTCKHGYFRPKPTQRICVPCPWRCWVGFVLSGHCTQNTTTTCLKVGRDISEEEAAQWPKGRVHPPTTPPPVVETE
eukprot:m.212158 g.212158  ORF g.212158 m.212158 type:complete len:498 (+) comp25520_c0_seq1:63-1556(+)